MEFESQLSGSATNASTYAGLSGLLLLSYFLLFIVFSFSHFVENKVDDIVFVGFTRLFGLIVAAIAVQFMVEGLG